MTAIPRSVQRIVWAVAVLEATQKAYQMLPAQTRSRAKGKLAMVRNVVKGDTVVYRANIEGTLRMVSEQKNAVITDCHFASHPDSLLTAKVRNVAHDGNPQKLRRIKALLASHKSSASINFERSA